MKKYCAIPFLLAACLCSLSCCQVMEGINTGLLETVLQKMDALSLRLEDSQSALEEKVEGVLTKLIAVEGQIAELQESTGPNSQLQIFVQALEMEIDRCTMMVNGTWRSEVATLQESFSTEISKVKEEIQVSSSKDQIRNLQGLMAQEISKVKEEIQVCSSKYQIRNLKGLMAQEISKVKEEIQVCSSKDQIRNLQWLMAQDECSLGTHQCSSYATCEDALVYYKCKCLPGFSGDGFTCTEHSSCDSPSKHIRGLGCVIPVRVNMTWDDAHAHCQGQGSRLLEGITTQGQLDQLKEHFLDLLKNGRYGIWIGMRMWKWHQGGDHIDDASPLWHSVGEPGKGNAECGLVWLHVERPSFGDDVCQSKVYSLCQKI